MLVELQQLASTLSRFGLQTGACHPWVESELVVCLLPDGKVGNVEFRPASDVAGRFRYRRTIRISFPAIKIISETLFGLRLKNRDFSKKHERHGTVRYGFIRTSASAPTTAPRMKGRDGFAV